MDKPNWMDLALVLIVAQSFGGGFIQQSVFGTWRWLGKDYPGHSRSVWEVTAEGEMTRCR